MRVAQWTSLVDAYSVLEHCRASELAACAVSLSIVVDQRRTMTEGICSPMGESARPGAETHNIQLAVGEATRLHARLAMSVLEKARREKWQAYQEARASHSTSQRQLEKLKCSQRRHLLEQESAVNRHDQLQADEWFSRKDRIGQNLFG